MEKETFHNFSFDVILQTVEVTAETLVKDVLKCVRQFSIGYTYLSMWLKKIIKFTGQILSTNEKVIFMFLAKLKKLMRNRSHPKQVFNYIKTGIVGKK